MNIVELNTSHSGNWINASETKPELHGDTLGIENASWRTGGHGQASINTIVAVNTDYLTSVCVGYRYNGRYRGGAQYWQHYQGDGHGWKRVTWKQLDDGERMLVLDAYVEDHVPGWCNVPGKLTRDYLKKGELQRLEIDEQGTIYGYKYLLQRSDGQFASPQYPEIVWQGGELEADREPAGDNSHGIYAMKSRKNKTLYRYAAAGRHLVRLALSGTVVEANEGMRAQRALIVEVLS